MEKYSGEFAFAVPVEASSAAGAVLISNTHYVVPEQGEAVGRIEYADVGLSDMNQEILVGGAAALVLSGKFTPPPNFDEESQTHGGSNMTEAWMHDAQTPTEHHSVEYKSGREHILRMTTGVDLWLAIQQFAIDNKIRFARIHSAFMGGLQPARFLVWAPDSKDADNWHHEAPMEIQNLSMILALGGIIHVREVGGKEEPFPAIHFVTGGAWDVPTIGGHVLEGSIVKGVFELFITEIEGIDVIYGPCFGENFPENWYREL